MKFGLAYMGSHSPETLKREMADMRALGFDEVILAASENDFVYMQGKVRFSPAIAHDLGLKLTVNLWGFACAFGGGRISRLLSDEPEVMARGRDGKLLTWQWDGWGGRPLHAGCTNHPRVHEWAHECVEMAVKAGADGFFWDEPSKQECFCPECGKLFREHFRGDLAKAEPARVAEFRRWSVAHWVGEMSRWVKARDARLTTSTCVMPSDRDAWGDVARIRELDSLGTDTYWIFANEPLSSVREPCATLVAEARKAGKSPHLWLQCWRIPRGREQELPAGGKELAAAAPDTIYVWAYHGQEGTVESCEDPIASWDAALEALRAAGMTGRRETSERSVS